MTIGVPVGLRGIAIGVTIGLVVGVTVGITISMAIGMAICVAGHVGVGSVLDDDWAVDSVEKQRQVRRIVENMLY